MKRELGQFYSTKKEYLLTGMTVPSNTIIIEPFCGKGDLIKDLTNQTIEFYDIEPRFKNTIYRNTLLDPPDYKNKFVLTNPPYLASNKNINSTNKQIYAKYRCNDLYKCFIKSLHGSGCIGGIIIIPLNFLCSNRIADKHLRKQFLDEYFVSRINVFEEQVFEDTSYSVCCISFCKSTSSFSGTLPVIIFPEKKELKIRLTDYCIGGELFTLPMDNGIKISRATKMNKNSEFITNINLKCIDDQKSICLEYVNSEKRYIDNTPKMSARSYACLIVSNKGNTLSIEEQKNLVDSFNSFLNKKRKAYHSLFLTTYREYSRKRISFDFAFKLCNYLLSNAE